MADKLDFDKDTATEYDKGVRRTLPTYDPMLRLTHTFLRSNLSEDSSILIIGGGGGNELKAFGLQNPSWYFTAVDPSEAMLEVARMKSYEQKMEERVEFIHGTVFDVPEEAIFNGATCILVLHFIPEIDEKLALLKKLRAHLKAGSPFVLVSKYGDPESVEFRELVTLWKNHWLDTTNLSEEKVEELMKKTLVDKSVSEETIRQLLEKAGFHKITKFFKTNHFGGWLCYAK